MFDEFALRQIFSVQSAAWAGVCLLALALVRLWNGIPAIGETWILWRQTKAAEKVSDWARLRDEIKRLSAAEERCRQDYAELHSQHMDLHQRYAELHSRITHLEAYHAGQGKAAQEAAGIVALERIKNADKGGEPK